MCAYFLSKFILQVLMPTDTYLHMGHETTGSMGTCGSGSAERGFTAAQLMTPAALHVGRLSASSRVGRSCYHSRRCDHMWCSL